MSVQNLTLNVPEALFDQIKEMANQRNLSVEDETLDLIANAIPNDKPLPRDLADAVAPLALLDSAALWRAARGHFPAKAAAKLESLHLKRQREGLTTAEQQKADALVRQYERAMLVRAKATQILHERGVDVSELGPK